MKAFIHMSNKWIRLSAILSLLILFQNISMAQDQQDTTAAPEKTVKPVKNVFESNWIIDNQTALVPIKGTFEFNLQHRFGSFENGAEDLYGLFGSASIRLGFSYVPHDRVQLGVGLSKYYNTVDGSLKVAILRQSSGGGSPVTVTYFGDMAMNTKSKQGDGKIYNFSDRYTFFNQLLVARKVTDNFTAQVALSVSHQNVVDGYYSDSVTVSPIMHHNHFAIAFSGRYRVSPVMCIIANYDQPITEHPAYNPKPNISAGIEVNTSAHTFEVFIGNYSEMIPQINNMYNQNDYHMIGQYRLGFILTRWWNF